MLIVFIFGLIFGMISWGIYNKIKDPEMSMSDIFIDKPMILLGETDIGMIIIVILGLMLLVLLRMLKKAGITTIAEIKDIISISWAKFTIFIILYYKQLITVILIMIGLFISVSLVFTLFFFIMPISKYQMLIAIMYFTVICRSIILCKTK